MSKQATSILRLSLVSGGVVTQYRGVDFNGNQIAAQGAKAIGIAQFGAPAAGDDLTVVAVGTAICETGAAIAVGQSLILDNQGRVIPNTGAIKIAAGAVAVTSAAANGAADLTGSDLPEYVIGDALQAASGAGQFIEVLLR